MAVVRQAVAVAVARQAVAHCHQQRIKIQILPIGMLIVWVVTQIMEIVPNLHVLVEAMMVQAFFMKMVVVMAGILRRNGLGV
ncbi:hypothetical protein HMPREF2954_00080 [Neisseria sp. HMSC067H09]|nr:hypothetical protein HMPREF2954_00080 [Neisseria sp. HMSC067H09]